MTSLFANYQRITHGLFSFVVKQQPIRVPFIIFLGIISRQKKISR